MSGLAEHGFLKMNGLGNEIVVLDLRGGRLEVTPAEARKTSKPGAGVVKFAFEVINQKDELIQTGTMTVLMKTKDHPVPIKR